uniref:Protein MGF 360-3L n=1 Tax=African swine fever virus (isolate Tick/Malawi/Lil 20-1/1983) TaxID=10500 RepID=11011_ASFM2|nr:RecName: Full=Protein MGF 360-3L [African swine fever virus Malawi LIL 20/1]
MKVLLELLLGYSVLILAHELPYLPSTRHPPKEELPYWCTYVKNCDFCWDCQNDICKNKITNESISINSIVNCRVTRDSPSQSCFYEISVKMPNHHSMECSHPRPYTGNEIFMEKWGGGGDYWPIIIRHCCFYLVFSIAFVGYIVFVYNKNLHLNTTMKLLALLSILIWLSQPALNRPLSIFYMKQNLPRTYTPPVRELEYWCTYAKHCDFCWTCKDGMCKNKVFRDHPIITQNDYIVNCTVSRWHDRCMYEAHFRIHYQHNMNCSQPKDLEWFIELKRHVINQDDL